MIPVTKLKQNLDINKNLGEVIEVMKLASTLQFNQFRSSREPFVEFIYSLEAIFTFLSQKLPHNKFLETHSPAPSAIILISSDEGFLGELNVSLVNRLVDSRREDDRIFVLGRLGEEYLNELKISSTVFPSVTEKLEFERIEAVRDHILPLYIKGEISKVHVVYTRFVNITSQQIEFENLLPLTATVPSEAETNRAAASKKEFLFEPDIDTVIEGWVRLWVLFKLSQIFWSSKLAEFAARIMHLEGSIQELNKTNRHLQLEYFKYLHSISDKTISEIYASRLIRRNA